MRVSFSSDGFVARDGDRLADRVAALSLSTGGDAYIATASGTVMRTPATELWSRQRGPMRAIRLRDGDRVAAAALADGGDVVLVAGSGRMLRVAADAFRHTSRGVIGVFGMALSPGDHVVALIAVGEEDRLELKREDGTRQRVAVRRLARQRRNSPGARHGVRGPIVAVSLLRAAAAESTVDP